jgi:hypothetical protein
MADLDWEREPNQYEDELELESKERQFDNER